jgi:hypothetical protein
MWLAAAQAFPHPRLRARAAGPWLAAGILSCRAASALWGGCEINLRDFEMWNEYFIDTLSYELDEHMREAWHRSEMEPGGPRGWRFTYGSTGPYDGCEDSELSLRFAMDRRVTWFLRQFRGEDPDGRWSHVWTGVLLAGPSGHFTRLMGEPVMQKEFVDYGLGFGREKLAGPGRVRYRWEARLLFPDLMFDKHNGLEATIHDTPLCAQFSARANLRGRSWAGIEWDSDFPLAMDVGQSPLVIPEDRNYRFEFEKGSVDAFASLWTGDARRLWLRLKYKGSDRSRRHFLPGDAWADWEAAYDLWSAQVEWWRTSPEGHEVGVGLEHVDFDEDVRYPNLPPVQLDQLDDRSEEILYARCRRKVAERFYLTGTLYLDFADRLVKVPGEAPYQDQRFQGKFGLTIESPGGAGEVCCARFMFGMTWQLDSSDFGGAYGQWITTF